MNKITKFLLMITLIVGVVCLNSLPVFSASGSTSGEVSIDYFDFDKASTNDQTADGSGYKLKFYYKAGRIRNDNSVINVAAGYVTCTASQRNFIEVSPAGVVSAESSFTAGSIPLYTIYANASAIFTPVDKRAFLMATGILTTDTIVSTYGTGNVIAITVSEATNGTGAIKIVSTPTINDGEYHVPIWVDAQLALTGGGSIYGVRGHVGTIAGVTMDATGYQIGVHGRILNLGTVDNGGIIIAGLLGQTLTGGTYDAVSHMACAWLSWQSTTTVTSGETEILYLSHNAPGLTLDSFIYIYGVNPADYFIKFHAQMNGGWSDVGTTEGEECVGHLKVRYHGADAYINVFSDNS